MEEWQPSDWQENPPMIMKISDPTLQSFALSINQIWLQLGKQIKSEVADQPDRFSILDVPNPFIVPGPFFYLFIYFSFLFILHFFNLQFFDLHFFYLHFYLQVLFINFVFTFYSFTYYL